MATILGLPKGKYPFTQQNEMLCELIHAKLAASFQFVEAEVLPLLQQVHTSIDCAAEYSESGDWEHELPDGAQASIQKAVRLAHKLTTLVDCYRDILVPQSPDDNT